MIVDVSNLPAHNLLQSLGSGFLERVIFIYWFTIHMFGLVQTLFSYAKGETLPEVFLIVEENKEQAQGHNDQ